jgi:hypothetical protein
VTRFEILVLPYLFRTTNYLFDKKKVKLFFTGFFLVLFYHECARGEIRAPGQRARQADVQRGC